VSFSSTLRPLIAGEVLFDCFPDRRVLGGAPFNVAWNLRGLGSHPLMVSAVGQDEAGEEVIEAMRRWGLDGSALQVLPDHTTGRVDIELSGGEPSYRFWDDVAYDHIRVTDAVEAGSPWGIFYHGSLALRGEESRRTIFGLADRLDCPRFVDINLRPPHFDPDWTEPILRNAGHVKLNLAELVELAENAGLASAETVTAAPADDAAEGDETLRWQPYRGLAEELRERFEINNLWITAGKLGAAWSGGDAKWEAVPVTPVPQMLDTVGAGDAFAAKIIRGLSTEKSPRELLREAAAFAARVCGIRGAISVDPDFYAQTENRHDR